MTQHTLNLALPFPPSVNRIWRAVGGRVLLSLVARAYHRKAANALVHLPVDPIQTRVTMIVRLHPPKALVNREWDVANREKCLCDALTKQKIWRDDALVDDIRLWRGPFDPKYPDGAAVVTITYST